MRKVNLSPADKFRRENKELFDKLIYNSFWEITLKLTYPDGSDETLPPLNVETEVGMMPSLEPMYKKALKAYKVTESFFGGDKFWLSTEDGQHIEVNRRKVL